MLSVSIFFICPCCQAPGDPISIFLIPGDYIAMLGCRTGTKLMRAFLLPILTHLSHHITLCWLVLLFSPQSPCWPYSPELLQPVSLDPRSQDFGQTQPPSGSGCLIALIYSSSGGKAIAAQSPFVTEPFGQAWWTVIVLIPAFLFAHMHTYILWSLCICPAITAIYLLLSDLSIGKKILSA